MKEQKSNTDQVQRWHSPIQNVTSGDSVILNKDGIPRIN